MVVGIYYYILQRNFTKDFKKISGKGRFQIHTSEVILLSCLLRKQTLKVKENYIPNIYHYGMKNDFPKLCFKSLDHITLKSPIFNNKNMKHKKISVNITHMEKKISK